MGVIALALALILPLLAETTALAQDPAPITRLARSSADLTPAQQQEVEAYVREYVRRLETGEDERVRDARRRLAEPLTTPGLTRAFRFQYADILIPHLRNVAESGQTHVSVNALQILAIVATDAALGVALERMDPANEDRVAVRLWAANAFRLMLTEGGIRDRERWRDARTRDLARLASREESWLVLKRQMEALFAINNEESRERLVDVIAEVLDRIEQEDSEGPTEKIRALRRIIGLIRHQYAPELTPEEQRLFGQRLGPQIARVLEIAHRHWEAARADERWHAEYQGTVNVAERLLRAIDTRVRGDDSLRTNLETAWANGNQNNFGSQVSQWSEVVQGSPYRPR